MPRVAREESRGVGRFPSRNQSSPGLRSRRVFSLQASAVPYGWPACCFGLYIPMIVIGGGENFVTSIVPYGERQRVNFEGKYRTIITIFLVVNKTVESYCINGLHFVNRV